MLFGDRGSASILLAIIMLGITSATAYVIYDNTANLETLRKRYEYAESRKQIENELKIILSTQDICINHLKFGIGSNFDFGAIMSTGQYVGLNLKIDSMNLANQAPAVDGFQRADFVIEAVGRHDSSARQKITIGALYKVAGGTVTACHTIIDEQTACLNIGAVWDSLGSRCQLCEMMNGTWSDGACSVGG